MTRENPSQIDPVISIMKDIPDASNGDLKAFKSFCANKKPSSYIPHAASPDKIEQLLLIAKENIPDAEVTTCNPNSTELPMIFSRNAIEARVEKEGAVAEWLGIKDMGIDEILALIDHNQLVEGFVLGFPYTALRTYQKHEELKKKAPALNDFVARKTLRAQLFSHWERQDLDLLERIRERYSRINNKITLHAFCNSQNIKPILKKFYKKYYQLSNDEIEFLFSVQSGAPDDMNYIDSPIIQAEEKEERRLTNAAIQKTLDQ